jgi:hydroxylamine reductase
VLETLTGTHFTVEELVALNLQVGETNVKVMELLDSAHTSTFGHPTPTSVSTVPSAGKCILVSGHDIVDLYQILKQTENMDINVYTHGEMLPAHGYPALRKFPHLKGHFGNAWQRQKLDFTEFPGAVLMTSNCITQPLETYQDRIFTVNSVRLRTQVMIDHVNALCVDGIRRSEARIRRRLLRSDCAC